MDQTLNWGVIAIDMWNQNISNIETWTKIANSFSSDTLMNNTDMNVITKRIKKQLPYENFDDMILMPENLKKMPVSMRQYHAFLIDFLTNNPVKYGNAKQNFKKWKTIFQYITEVTSICK